MRFKSEQKVLTISNDSFQQIAPPVQKLISLRSILKIYWLGLQVTAPPFPPVATTKYWITRPKMLVRHKIK